MPEVQNMANIGRLTLSLRMAMDVIPSLRDFVLNRSPPTLLPRMR